MLGFNPNNFMAVAQGVGIRRGPGGKGAKGGLFRSQCDFLAMIYAFTLIIIRVYQQTW